MKLNEHRPTTKAPSEKFTGAVYLSPLNAGESPSRLIAALVHFSPGARTNWHSHPLGQTLHCTEGAGVVATRDGTVILMRRVTPSILLPERNTGTVLCPRV
jgi:quercetin dioxygenase-like cupin family protein